MQEVILPMNYLQSAAFQITNFHVNEDLLLVIYSSKSY